MRLTHLETTTYDRLTAGRFYFGVGPLRIAVRAKSRRFAEDIEHLFGAHEILADTADVPDFLLHLREVRGGKYRWFADGTPLREPFPPNLTLAHFEWAVHDTVSEALAPALALHAGVAVAPDGRALALVGQSGSGKSTLVAGLVAMGWSLVSDEFLLLGPTGKVRPLPGLITLKNHAIEAIAPQEADFALSAVAMDSSHGRLMHLAARRRADPELEYPLAAVVYPRFSASEGHQVDVPDRSWCVLRLIADGHNDHVLGESGFHQIAALSRLPSRRLVFDDLQGALATIAHLMASVL